MLNRPLGNGPELLVSVRNAEEALAAIQGGADILDIKEPRHGSLGKADDSTIAEIAQAVRSVDRAMPIISVALGELLDWESSSTVPRLPQDVGFVKLGLSGCADDDGWRTKWRTFRERFQTNNPHSPGWVMVMYADRQRAKAPSFQELIEAAVEFSCQAVLVDTFHKEGRSLVEVLSPPELIEMSEAVHQSGLPFAVAGSLRPEDLSRLHLLSPQIIAIRSAACQEGKRNGSICPQAVRQFRKRLRECFAR